MFVTDSVRRPRTRSRGDTGDLTAEPALRVGGIVADLVTLARPTHAAKSMLLVPLAFLTAPRWTAAGLVQVAWATAAFVLAGACVYVGNDLADRGRDRLHPVKCLRPIAAGRVPVAVGYLYCAGLLAALAAVAGRGGGRYWPVLAYLGLNIAYSAALKHVPLVDVGVVAFGLVLRVVQGYVSTGQQVPGWLLVAVFSVALLMLIGKRRDELVRAGPGHRPALRGYSLALTDQLLPLTGTLAVVAGLVYLSSQSPFGAYGSVAMLLSTPFALFALARYLQVLLVDGGGGDPVRVLLGDRTLLGAALLWACALGTTFLLARYSVGPVSL